MDHGLSKPLVDGSTRAAPRSDGLPPGPPDPFDFESVESPLEAMCALHRCYGDIYGAYSPRRRRHAIVVVHPEHLKHVLVDNRENYRKGVGFERVRMLLGNGIIVSDGAFWRRQRRMVQPAFRRERVALYAAGFPRICMRLLEAWSRRAEAGESVDVTADTSVYALECVLHALFGEDVARLAGPDGRNPFMLVAEDSARDLKFAQAFRRLGALIGDLVAERRAEATPRCDILDALIGARDAETGEPMSEAQIIDEVLTLVVAGHETTASTLNWTWHLLSRQPGPEAKLHQEVDDVCSDGAPGVADLPRLGYTGQILDEAMRLYPPVWRFTRRALADDEIGGYRIPAGSDLYICPYLTHRHPEFWDAPEDFRPERFDEESRAARHRLAFVPFSAGARRCIGDWMAMVEMRLHLATVARELRLVSDSDAPVEMLPEINLRSRGAIHLMPVRRETNR